MANAREPVKQSPAMECGDRSPLSSFLLVHNKAATGRRTP